MSCVRSTHTGPHWMQFVPRSAAFDGSPWSLLISSPHLKDGPSTRLEPGWALSRGGTTSESSTNTASPRSSETLPVDAPPLAILDPNSQSHEGAARSWAGITLTAAVSTRTPFAFLGCPGGTAGGGNPPNLCCHERRVSVSGRVES